MGKEHRMGAPSLTRYLETTASVRFPLASPVIPSSELCRESQVTSNSYFAKQAVTDAPCVNFADELLSAYPDAKVVLTTRDVDRWLPSMERSYYKILAWKWWMALAAVDDVSPVFDFTYTAPLTILYLSSIFFTT